MNVKKFISAALALLLALSFAGFAPQDAKAAAPTVSLAASVKTASDDMEEWFSTGVMDYNSSDLEIGLEKPGTGDGTPQYVGLRFADLAIPQGATIESAYIQFTVDEVKTPANPFEVSIFAEDTDNSVTFNNGATGASVLSYDISSRTRTAGSVVWSLNTDDSLWTTEGEAAEKERTPDVSAIVQSVVNRSGWASGNAVSFILLGTGNRTAISYDKDPAKAPVLHLTYSYEGQLEQAAPTGLTGVAPTTDGGTDGKITGTTAEMEYRPAGGSNWTACGSGETTGLAPGTYSVRYAEKEGYNAGAAADVTIPEYIFVQTAPTGVYGIPLTTATSNDGMILGVTSEMEYKKSYETTWTICPDALISDLAAGVYNVRYAATADAAASEAIDIAVSAVTKVAMSIYEDDAISANATNAMGFAWYTVAESQNSDLQVVKKTSKAPNFEGKNVLSFSGDTTLPANAISTNLSKAQEYLHKAVATGLKANTTYYFRVGDASLDLWSETGSFTTAASKGAFTFLDLADPQAKELDEAILSAETFEAAVETVPEADFIAINGDIVDSGSNETQWDWLFNNMSDVMMNYPIAAIAGNHESQAYSFINHFNICPATGSDTKTGAYYSFDYSNAHFVMLNTNENSAAYSDFSVAQVNWMTADIEAAKAEGKWIIALLHKGPYTTSNHATDSDIMGPTGVRKLIAPIFANLGVDLVLQGHDHIYARSKAIMEDGTADSTGVITEIVDGQEIDYQIDPDGAVYLIPATAGPKVYYKNKSASLTNAGYYGLFDVADESHSAVYGADPSDASRPLRSMVDNFESITINGDKLTVISYEIDHGGLLSDSEEPYVIDTFGIVKDTKAPTLTVKGITDKQTFELNQNVPITWTATDDKGVESVTANAVANGLLDTSSVGTHTLTVTAVDYAGNTATKTYTYSVVYRFSGFLTPLGTSTFKSGVTVPVMFYLKDSAGTVQKNATARLYIAKQKSNGKYGAETAAVPRITKNGNQFQCYGGIYLFDLYTKSLTAGNYQLRIDLGDGSVNTITIKIK